MTETALVIKIKKHIETRCPGAIVIKMHGSPMMPRGLPDLLILHNGNSLFVEVKLPGRKLTRIQSHWIDRLLSAGIVAGVVTGVEDVDITLKVSGML